MGHIRKSDFIELQRQDLSLTLLSMHCLTC